MDVFTGRSIEVVVVLVNRFFDAVLDSVTENKLKIHRLVVQGEKKRRRMQVISNIYCRFGKCRLRRLCMGKQSNLQIVLVLS